MGVCVCVLTNVFVGGGGGGNERQSETERQGTRTRKLYFTETDSQTDRERERETDSQSETERETIRDREDVPKALTPSCTQHGFTRRQCQFLGSLSVGGVYEGSAELETGLWYMCFLVVARFVCVCVCV